VNAPLRPPHSGEWQGYNCGHETTSGSPQSNSLTLPAECAGAGVGSFAHRIWRKRAFSALGSL
jgi:hypothetical protein